MTEAIYLLLTKGFEERCLVDGYSRHIGATYVTSEPQQRITRSAAVVEVWITLLDSSARFFFIEGE